MRSHGKDCATPRNIVRIDKVLMHHFGASTMLSAIGRKEVSDFVVWLGEQPRYFAIPGDAPSHRSMLGTRLGASQINHHLKHLRAVMNMARDDWGYTVQRFKWALRDEPEAPNRILSEAEEAKVFTALTPDMLPIYEFSLLSGVRQGNAVRLRKDQVNFDAGVIRFRIKSRKREGKVSAEKFDLPITNEIEAILRAEWDNHPVYVFTYVSERNCIYIEKETGERVVQRKGQRYPMTRKLLVDRWAKACKKAGIAGLTWHRIRATMITRTIDETGSVKTAMISVGHKDEKTTMRYDSRNADDVRAAISALAKKRAQARKAARIRVAT
jgi:integrase